MISKDLEGQILRLYHVEKWRVGTISQQLGIHHSAVRRVIVQESEVKILATRPRMVDLYLPFIKEALAKYPTLPASRLYDMVKERGFQGKPSQFRAVIAEIRPPSPAEAFLRLKTLPGEQAQVDWGHFGQLQCGRAHRPLMAFVIVLSHCRAIFLRFFLSQHLSSFLHGHELAFQWFGGVPRVCLFDNLKSVVLERTGAAIVFNHNFMDFAAHYRFEPRPVAVARGNEKGRTERAIRYIRTNFFPARRFKDLNDLNRQALHWCESAALDRRWIDDPQRTVGQVFVEEKPLLLPLPANPYPCDERKEVSIAKTPYARFDLNDYSVPPQCVQKTLTINASIETVRILDGSQIVASHPRSYDRGQQITIAEHIETLRAIKKKSTEHNRTNILAEVTPSATKLLKLMAERGFPLTRATNELLSLLNAYGPEMLEEAITEALANNAPHPHAVRHVLERKRQEQGKTAPLPSACHDDPRLQQLHCKPHSLSNYGNLLEKSEDDTSEENNS